MFEFFEDEAMARGYRFVVGCDEAGRGPLVGPVVGAAVHLPKEVEIEGLGDSKKLSQKKREQLYHNLRSNCAIKIGVGIVSAQEIDEINILQASLKAMKMAVQEIGPSVDYIFIDGNKVFESGVACQAVVRGDSRVRSISAASIIAKVERDEIMTKLASAHPEYGFDRHKGYPTKAHLEALEKYGPLDEHRMTFGPLKSLHNYCS